ncbi:MAG: hypothetical protein RIM33_06475 [Alphaproteobacteria bacterium]
MTLTFESWIAPVAALALSAATPGPGWAAMMVETGLVAATRS